MTPFTRGTKPFNSGTMPLALGTKRFVSGTKEFVIRMNQYMYTRKNDMENEFKKTTTVAPGNTPGHKMDRATR